MESRPTELRMRDDGRKIAVLVDEGHVPGLLWLGGFRSDMTGSKAEALAAYGRQTKRRVVRFDYSGHGASDGPFAAGTIGRWADEAEAVLAHFSPEPTILVGSSMGGWISLLLAERLARAGERGRLAGMVLIAPAPDFTERLMLPSFTDRMRSALAETGKVTLPNAYGDEPTTLSAAFFEDARSHLVLDRDIRLDVPVHVLQGMKDPDVPFTHALALVDRLVHDDVVVTLIKDGDHRLSRPEDIVRLIDAVEAMATRDGERAA